MSPRCWSQRRSAGAGRRPRGAHRSGDRIIWSSWRRCCNAPWSMLGPDEFSLAASAQPEQPQPARRSPQADVILGMEMTRLLAHAALLIPAHARPASRPDQTGRQTHQSHLGRSQLPFQLPGFPALPRRRSGARGRRGSEPARPDRRLRALIDKAKRSALEARGKKMAEAHQSAMEHAARPGGGRLGLRAHHHGAAGDGNL